jgi:hypothetical protein
MFCAALRVPTAWLPKLKLVGERPMSAPVPVRGTACGLPIALSVIVMAPVRVPVAVGSNFTVIVQCDPALIEVPQLFVSEKSPLGTMLVIPRAAVPVLLSLTVFDVLVVLICWLPKLRLVGEKLMVGAIPVPVRATVCGLPVALSVTVIVPPWLPVVVGVNVTLMMQLPPAATEAPQALVSAYGALATMLVTLNAAAPPLVSVMLCAALAAFKF